MTITLRQSYLAAFQILDEIFDDTKNEQLGNFLSGMNPYLFTDSISADPATWHEWVSCANKVQNGGVLTADNAFQTLISFLRFNEEQYGYRTNMILDEMQNPSYQKRWKQLLQKAETIADA
jgi:hypothetical protein